MVSPRESLGRGLTVVVVVAFLGALAYYLVRPGYTWTRLAFFAVLGGLVVAGAVGVLTRRKPVTAVGAVGLLLLGFWQAVLWMYVLPVVAVLLVAVLIAPEPGESRRAVRR